MRSEPRSLGELRGDDEGAIMLVGLAAALVLIGALWFLIGIADTIVFRERMQEAVDAAAFSAAAIHARGMNFVAAINLIMLALVTIHVVIGIVADVLTIIAAVCLPTVVCSAASPPAFTLAHSVRRAQSVYDRFMWPTLGVLNTGQTVIAVGAPWIGTAAAAEVGADYAKGEASVAALGPSNVPTGAPDGAAAPETSVGTTPYPRANIRLGLPVAFERMNAMCTRPISWAINWVQERIEKLPVIAQLIAIPVAGAGVKAAIGAAANALNGLVGGVVTYLECDDGSAPGLPGFLSKIRKVAAPFIPFGAPSDVKWGQAGGKTIWGSAANGTPWMQVWAWTTSASTADTSEAKVGIGRNVFGDIGTPRVSGTWVAQAEFYYDCRSAAAWDSTSCNGSGTLGSHFTMYSMRWKARLRRVRSPSFARFLFDTGTASADALGWTNKVVSWIPLGTGQRAKIGSSAIGGAVQKGTDWVRKQLTPGGGEEVIH